MAIRGVGQLVSCFYRKAESRASRASRFRALVCTDCQGCAILLYHVFCTFYTFAHDALIREALHYIHPAVDNFNQGPSLSVVVNTWRGCVPVHHLTSFSWRCM